MIIQHTRPVLTISPRSRPMHSAVNDAVTVNDFITPRDVITAYDDGSALVIGKNGNDYTIDSTGQCSCPALRLCRHSEKLTAQVVAEKRLAGVYLKASVVGREISNEKCAGCGTYPVKLLMWGRYNDTDRAYAGTYRFFNCCGCEGNKVLR